MDSTSCTWLGNFYFDARCPGDNFVLVSKADAVESYKILEQIYKDVTHILQNISNEHESAVNKLQSFKAFN